MTFGTSFYQPFFLGTPRVSSKEKKWPIRINTQYASTTTITQLFRSKHFTFRQGRLNKFLLHYFFRWVKNGLNFKRKSSHNFNHAHTHTHTGKARSLWPSFRGRSNGGVSSQTRQASLIFDASLSGKLRRWKAQRGFPVQKILDSTMFKAHLWRGSGTFSSVNCWWINSEPCDPCANAPFKSWESKGTCPPSPSKWGLTKRLFPSLSLNHLFTRPYYFMMETWHWGDTVPLDPHDFWSFQCLGLVHSCH